MSFAARNPSYNRTLSNHEQFFSYLAPWITNYEFPSWTVQWLRSRTTLMRIP
jgi:hypothetical protein